MAKRKLMTSTEVASAAGMKASQALYIIRTRRLKPVLRAGTFRLFDEMIVEQLRKARAKIESRRRRVVV